MAVGSSSGSRKRGLKSAPEQYHAVGNDLNRILMLSFLNTLKIK